MRALVCGAGGFIGHHLVAALKRRGCFVRGVDLKHPEYSPSAADEFLLLDLRRPEACERALDPGGGAAFDRVYQLAADMGGMGFIHDAECEIMTHSALINLHVLNAASNAGVGRYFFASSACVYPDQPVGADYLDESDAYPALPDNEYGWEKLYAERTALAFARNRDLEVRIARFQNCYGPEGTWDGGREKAPAAICRKVALARSGDTIDVWGDGSVSRVFTYVADTVEGIWMLTESGVEEPVNVGSSELVTVKELVEMVAEIAGKDLRIRWVEGPVGVRARYHRVDRMEALGWRARWSLRDGLRETYAWIESQVKAAEA